MLVYHFGGIFGIGLVGTNLFSKLAPFVNQICDLLNWLPRCFSPAYNHVLSKSSDIQHVIEPRCTKAFSYSDQFLTRYNVLERDCVLFCLGINQTYTVMPPFVKPFMHQSHIRLL